MGKEAGSTRGMRLTLALGCVLALLVPAAPVRAEEVWNSVAPMAEPRANATSILLPSGEVLVAGGFNGFVEGVGGGTTPVKLAERFDPVSRTWRRAAPMAVARDGEQAALLPNGNVMVIGGIEGGCCGEPAATAETYDPQNDTWSPAPAPSELHEIRSLTALADRRLLLVGDFGGTSWLTRTARAMLYDPASGEWSSAAKPLARRLWATTTLLAGGDVLVAGGEEFREAEFPAHTIETVLASTEVYEPTTDTWQAAAPMAHPRVDHVAVRLPDRSVLVAGGLESSIGGPALDELEKGVATAEAFDPSEDAWRPLPSMSFARTDAAAVSLGDGRALVAGGGECSTAPGYDACFGFGTPPAAGDCCAADTAEVYEPAAGRWTVTGPVAGGTHPSLTAFAGGEALLAGGNLWLGSHELSSAYVYGLAPPSVPQTPAAAPRPTLSGLRERRRRWRERRSTSARGPVGTTFSYTLSEVATVHLQFERIVPGHRAGRRCEAGRPEGRAHARRCTRLLADGALTVHGSAGRNAVGFDGMVGRRRLPPGSYRLLAYASSPSGRSPIETLSFTIIR